MKKLYIFFSFIFLLHNVVGQSISSVSLDSVSVFQFTPDAIYFESSQGIIKTDYQLNVIWAKDNLIRYGRGLFFTVDGVYGLYGHYAFKVDALGNSVWQVDLSNKVCTMSVDTNIINAITVSGNRVYVSALQGNYNSSNYYSGIITLDTSGSIINSICEGFTSKANIGMKGVPAKSHGTWIAFDESGGGHGFIVMAKYDSTGSNYPNANRINTGGGDFHNVVDVIALPDSDFLVVNYFGLSLSGVTEIISCTKFNEHGDVLWQNNFTSIYTGPWNSKFAEVDAVTSDDNGNIYLKGRVMDSTYIYTNMKPVIIKMDKDGNLLSLKAWSDSLLNSAIQIGNKLFYRNGSIYASGQFGNKEAIIVLDTAFSNPCFALDSTMSLATYPLFFISFSNTYYLSSPFTAPKISSIPFNSISSSLISKDICTALIVKEQSYVKPIIISPNPFHETATLQINDLRFTNYDLRIYDMMGRLVQRQIINSPSTIIPRNSLADGIYFYQLVNNSGEIASGKFVVE